jgi:plasmid stability protein
MASLKISFGAMMTLNFSIKNVPDTTAQRLRARAERNHRSLQGELMAILEAAAVQDTAAAQDTVVAQRTVEARAPSHMPSPVATLSLDEIVERARRRFPQGTAHLGRSVDIIREMRDQRDGNRPPR